MSLRERDSRESDLPVFRGSNVRRVNEIMAILKIARMGHPVLAQTAHAVANPGSPEIRRLVSDMIETMIDANGAGLAAPQVHVPLRVVVFQAPEERVGAERVEEGLTDAEAFDHTAPLTVLINPVVE